MSLSRLASGLPSMPRLADAPPRDGQAARALVAHRFHRVAAALGLERVDGRWTLPALASYFEDPPSSRAGAPRP